MKTYTRLYQRQGKGPWLARWKDGKKVGTRSTGSANRAAAEAILKAWQIEGDSAPVAFESTWKEYRRWAIDNRKPSYVERLDLLYKRLARDLAPSVLTDLTHVRLVEWMDKRTDSPHSKRHDIAFLRSFYRWCKDRGYTSVSPAADVRISVAGHERPKRAPISPDELERLLTAIINGTKKSWGRRWMYYMVGVQAHSGLRYDTMRRVEWQHINLVESRWEIPKELMKMRTDFVVPIHPTCMEYLTRWLQWYTKWYCEQNHRNTLRPNTRLFPQLDKQTPGTTLRHLKEFCRDAGIQPIGTHMLREYFEGLLRRQNVDPAVYSALMAHRDPATGLRHYGRPLWSELEKAVDARD